MLVKLIQPLNAFPPIHVTLLPIVTLFKLEQPSNAELPILVTPFGIFTFVIFLLSLKAPE